MCSDTMQQKFATPRESLRHFDHFGVEALIDADIWCVRNRAGDRNQTLQYYHVQHNAILVLF